MTASTPDPRAIALPGPHDRAHQRAAAADLAAAADRAFDGGAPQLTADEVASMDERFA